MALNDYTKRRPKAARDPLLAIVVASAYYLSAKFGLSLSFKPDYIAAMWPPNAILLAALLIAKPKSWPWFLGAAIPAELAADLPSGISFGMSIGFVGSDWIEVLTAAILFRKFSESPPEFVSIRQMGLYILLCVIVAPFTAAFFGALITGTNQAGPAYLTRWSQWFVGDAITHLLLTPFIVLWLGRDFSQIKTKPFTYYLKLLLLAGMLLLLSVVALSGIMLDVEALPAIIYLPLPVLLWISVRFGVRGIFSSAVIVAIVCIWFGSHGYGPFIEHSAASNVVNLQLFLSLTLTPMLLLAALVENHKRTEAKLLESEQKYRSLFDSNSSMIMIIDSATGDIFDANPAACSYYGYSRESLIKMNITDINMLSERDLRKNMQRAKLCKRYHFIFDHRLSNGTIREVEVFSGPININGKSMLCSVVHDISKRKAVERKSKELIKELKKALSEVKTLRGFLPICSSCKKIRDDKGYWNQIETYIRDHSEAEFSHGICPECLQKNYPEFFQ